LFAEIHGFSDKLLVMSDISDELLSDKVIVILNNSSFNFAL